jgi:hypothetical protein
MPQGPFQPIYPNPYIVGNPIRSREMFFGRVDEFRFIERTLENGQKTSLIVLYGERRSGKSSILYQILNGELGEAFLPIFVDMQIMAGIGNDAEFFGRIITDTCKALGKNSLSPAPYSLLFNQTTPTEVFRRFLKDLKVHFPTRSILLLIDEYEILEAKIVEGSLSPHVLTFFAGLLETELVSFVFTGSRRLETRDQTLWGGGLLQKATSRKISFLTKEDTTRLVTQPLTNKVTFAPEMVAQIYILTAGQPFYTQMICQNLVYHLNEVLKYDVTEQDLQAVVDGILENPPPQLIFNWGEHSSRRKLALSLLAEFSEAPETFLSARELCRGIARHKLELDLDANFFNTELSSLFQDEYILQKGRKYAFRLDLYRRWARHDHNVWQVKKEIGAKEIARITKQAHVKEEKKKKTFRRLEHALAFVLTIVAIYLAQWLFFEKQRHVIIQANGGPFWVLVDGDTVKTKIIKNDSTRVETLDKYTEGTTHDFKIILQASACDSVLRPSYKIEDNNEITVEFKRHPVMVVTDAASVEMWLGGDSVKTKEDQPEAWRHTFQVCAGKYELWAKDRRTGEEQNSVITVPVASNPVIIDFDRVAVLTLVVNHYPFEYSYEWSNSQERRKSKPKQADSSTVILQGQPKGSYRFNFTYLRNKQWLPIDTTVLVQANTMIAIKFVKKPPPPPPGETEFTLELNSDPQGASVYESGRFWNKTPFDTTLKHGAYSFTFKKAGYDSTTKQITLAKNDTLSVKLIEQYGYLKLVVQDERGWSLPNVRVFVDGGFVGETPVNEIRLPATGHALRLERSAYTPKDTSFVITKGDTLKLPIRMRK